MHIKCLTSAFKEISHCVRPYVWRGTGWREPGRIGAGGGREAGGDGAGCGSHVRAGGGRRMRGIKFFDDFLVSF